MLADPQQLTAALPRSGRAQIAGCSGVHPNRTRRLVRIYRPTTKSATGQSAVKAN